MAISEEPIIIMIVSFICLLYNFITKWKFFCAAFFVFVENQGIWFGKTTPISIHSIPNTVATIYVKYENFF